MPTAVITFEIKIPDVGATDEQIDDWIRVRLNDISRAATGPLLRYGIEPVPGTLLIERRE